MTETPGEQPPEFGPDIHRLVPPAQDWAGRTFAEAAPENTPGRLETRGTECLLPVVGSRRQCANIVRGRHPEGR